MSNDLPRPLTAQSEVYERLAAGWDATLNSLGMQRVSRVSWPCWVLKSTDTGDEHVYLSLQVDEKATDVYAGGGFRIELEKSASSRPAAGLNGRALFFQLLTESELGDVLRCQNDVIRALPKPPTSHVHLYPDGPVRAMYLSYFQPQVGFDAVRPWLRYRSTDDIDGWARTLSPLMKELVMRAHDLLRRDTRHLGTGSLVGAA